MRSVGACLALLLMTLTPLTSLAADCQPWVARVQSLEGTVEITRDQGARWLPAQIGQTFCFGDQLRVRSNSRASIELNNDTVLRLDEKSTLILPQPTQREFSFVELLRGALHLISRVKGSLEVRTPFVNAGLEGTEFVVRVSDHDTTVSVIEGTVAVGNVHGQLKLTGGQTAVAARGAAPVLRLDLAPEDAVHWALYYPMISDATGSGPADAILETQRLLQVGRVGEASTAIESALRRNPGDGEALALASVIAVAQNRKTDALALAERAVAAGESAPALLAMSYAHQAAFDLEAAHATASQATRQFPDQALLWSRLAETQASLGDLGSAVQSARHAVELDPSSSRARSVLGFAYLARAQQAAAQATFEEAVGLDTGDPLPRLGLGLAKIRQGQLAEGRREMEIAVSLDPSNALVRSYLGKAYLDERRYAEAATELELGKALDPRDPSPWLYSAVLNSIQGLDIQAFSDIQESVVRNDNRAVYRSRLMLDQDLAVRSAALGRVYNALGFGQRGLLEGWLSTLHDPRSFAAHELLADTYSSLPRHEIAELSERLQAQLLQPHGLSAVQPQLSQNRLGIVGSAFQTALSHRELGTLYDGDGGHFAASLLAGGNGTEALDVTATAEFGPIAVGVGRFDYSTDGFHANDAQEQSISNLVLRSQVADGTSLLAEVRKREVDSGQPNRFFSSAIDPTRKESREQQILRIGGRHDFNAANTSLAAVTFRDEDFSDVLDFGIFTFPLADSNVEEKSAEWRHIWAAPFGNLTFGLSHADTERLSTYTGFPPTTEPTDTTHTTAYLYANLPVSDTLEVTLGLGADRFETETVRSAGTAHFERKPLNPKLGVVWRPSDALTVRAALSRSMTRIVLDAQTIEPTHVAGFNQFYDDLPGTLSRNLGAALDYRLDERTFVGIEAHRRDLDIPADFANQISDHESDERTARVYLAKVISPNLAGSLQYQYEEIVRDDTVIRNIDGFERSKIHRLPIDLRYLSGTGFSASWRTSFVHQEGVFQTSFPGFPPTFGNGSDSFWVTDVRLSQRLPGNRGTLTLGVENLFDSAFRFQDTDTSRSSTAPERRAFVQLNLSF